MGEHKVFERAIETLLADRSPCKEALRLSIEQRQMLRIAQRLRGSRCQGAAPDFFERLRVSLLLTSGADFSGNVWHDIPG
ncbi:MAG TPA: hypothetical protein VF898_10775 [Chloroflexota bacterium]